MLRETLYKNIGFIRYGEFVFDHAWTLKAQNFNVEDVL